MIILYVWFSVIVDNRPCAPACYLLGVAHCLPAHDLSEAQLAALHVKCDL